MTSTIDETTIERPHTGGRFSKYEIPDGVRVICDNAFRGCSELEEISIPSSVNFIGAGAFSGCSKLSAIQLPNSLVFIGNGAFFGALSSITIPVSVEMIEGNPFDNKTHLISKSNKYIVQDDVLYTYDKKKIVSYCSQAKIFKIPEGVEVIGKDAFIGCESENIVFPSTLKIIEADAFNDCSDLSENLLFPDSLEEIHENAFDWCSFKNGCVTLPSNIKKIDAKAFSFGWHINLVKVPHGRLDYFREILPSWFSNQVIDEDYIYESGLFYNIDKTELFAATDVDFEGEIVIPSSVNKIRDGAFNGHYNINSIRFQNPDVLLSSNAFENEYLKIERIIVPKGMKERFESVFPKMTDNIVED